MMHSWSFCPLDFPLTRRTRLSKGLHDADFHEQRAAFCPLEFAFAATSGLLEANVVPLNPHFLHFKAIYEVLVMHWTCFYQRTPIWSN